ncbi:MAG: dTDP-4-dehydrorhamnose reductase [Pseudomonadota bacterium]
MTILVFGRTGQVATELRRQAEVTALGRQEADLSDPTACAEIIRQSSATAIINAAAYTAVDQAEDEEGLATTINGAAPAAMAAAAAGRGVPFLHVSTDYVFDGHGTRPWRPDDPVNPLGAYGRSKLAGETGIRAAGGPHAILRTSWVFSAHGSNFVKTMLRLAETRDTLTVVDDQTGGPTPAADIAATLLRMAQAMAAGHPGGTYHYGGQPAVTWADFARTISAKTGRSVTVTGIPSADYPTPATRPQNSRLDGTTLKRDFDVDPPDWQAGLDIVLAELAQK